MPASIAPPRVMRKQWHCCNVTMPKTANFCRHCGKQLRAPILDIPKETNPLTQALKEAGFIGLAIMGLSLAGFLLIVGMVYFGMWMFKGI